MRKIVILASGNGSNAEQIIKYFFYHEFITVAAVFSNKEDAFVLKRAKKYGIPHTVFSRDDLYQTNRVQRLLADINPDLIVLAGFLWLIPKDLIELYPNKIINIHPALLPKYGGKGMYGNRVHEAVINNREKESGITIHYVNEKYDAGDIIHQEKCRVTAEDTPETLAGKIHKIEHEAYPQIIESVIMGG